MPFGAIVDGPQTSKQRGGLLANRLPPGLAGWTEAAVPGVLKSMLFAYLVSHIAIAYGVASGQLAARSGTEDELHYVIWRSFRAAVLISTTSPPPRDGASLSSCVPPPT